MNSKGSKRGRPQRLLPTLCRLRNPPREVFFECSIVVGLVPLSKKYPRNSRNQWKYLGEFPHTFKNSIVNDQNHIFSGQFRVANQWFAGIRQLHRKPAFDQKLKEAKPKVKPKTQANPQSPTGNTDSTTLQSGDSLWSLIKSLLGSVHSDHLKNAVKKVAQHNGINIPEWGINDGQLDARKLLPGLPIDFSPLKNL